MAGITQYFTGELQFNSGAIRIPCLPGTTLSAPENWDSLDIIANDAFDVNYTAGLQYPVVSVPVAVTKEWFTAAILNGWFGLPTRSGPYYDVAAAGTATFWNGPSGSNNAWSLPNVKIASLSLGLSLGAYCEARIEFMATTLSQATFTPTSLPFLSNAVRSQNVTHDLVANPSRWDIQFTNNLMVNDELPQLTPLTGQFAHPTELNSGRFQASASLQFQRHLVTLASPVDGTPVTFTIHPPGATGGADVAIAITNPLYSGRYAQNLQRPRQKLGLQVICRGTDAGGAPVTFTAV